MRRVCLPYGAMGIFLAAILSAATSWAAPGFAWLQEFGAGSEDWAPALTRDPAGNLFVAEVS